MNARQPMHRRSRFKRAYRLYGEHFKPGAMRPSSEFPSPVRFAVPDASERRSP